MPRPDAGSFNRLLTTLGAVLLAASVVIPYFFFRSTEILRIPESELAELTETGRQTLEGRQDRIADLEIPVIILAGLLAAGGIALLIWGARRLREAQRVADERERAEKDLVVRQLTPAEALDKRQSEANEEVLDSLIATVAELEDAWRRKQAKAPDAEAATETAGRQLEQLAARATFRDDRQRIIERIEQRLALVFRNTKTLEGAQVKQNLLVASDEDRLELDAVIESAWTEPHHVLLELKIATDPRITSRVPRNYANAVLAQVTRYQRITGQAAAPWLLAVVPDEFESQFGEPAYTEVGNKLNDALGGVGEGTLILERDMEDLPRLFRSLFRSPNE